MLAGTAVYDPDRQREHQYSERTEQCAPVGNLVKCSVQHEARELCGEKECGRVAAGKRANRRNEMS